MALSVELGISKAFTLDDPVAGVLDNTDFVLGGVEFVDVTSSVRSVSLGRGKNRDLDRFNAGSLSVTFNNENRDFDPLFAGSPYANNIVPRRDVRVLAGTAVQYVGKVLDWNFSYEPNGRQSAELQAADGFTFLAQQLVTPGTATPGFTGARVNAVLDMETVDWPTADRDIDTGASELGADVFDGNALSYLQKVEQSEAGLLFIDKLGRVAFRDRLASPTVAGALVFSDVAGSGIPFAPAAVEYGSEQLFNQVTVTSPFATATANSTLSQTRYGILERDVDTLLSDESQAEGLANFLVGRDDEPEYRFAQIAIDIDKLSPAQEADVFGLEIGDVVQVQLTPGNPPTGTAIERYGRVISIAHSVEPDSHFVTVGVGSVQTSLFVLDDAEFGKLDGAGILAF
jgi:hypothetical protein